ncbi:MAG: metallophosphoesterase [Clostridia bacterium]|nr:metallophosphoesterase [Clostridia bacterium]
MDIFISILNNFAAFLMSVIMTVVPYKGIAAPVVDTKDDDCRLNIEMISDIHLEDWGFIRSGFLAAGLTNLKHAKAPIDAIMVDGDLTNYGDMASVDRFYYLFRKYSPVETLISVPGNHDIGHVEDRDHDEVREYLIDSYNHYAGTDYDKIYYSTEINGYKIIVLCDEGDRWDGMTISDEQMAFLDRELAEGTADGKPVFVCCHWPLDGMNGEDIIWDGCGIELDRYDVKSICEKYKNVFWISGHMHAGIKSQAVEEIYGLSNAEKIHGVTYITLPTYGIVSMYGIPWSCMGAQLEVYDDEVVFRPRNFATNNWYLNAEYTFTLD